ncbi:heparinase II/III-family protein [Paenibacillus sp. P96]|uniref:Heparinase II/III-family protein n=1 Tax=Paenibacillus zeirhizosphaerae TaxID=2987519 RepID=A0ABT9FRM2_9BACL|nr:heparinase II/III family protein [Paenibacillus sp. P96]MDP4097383.1 heparinase II/III-family protein [Paenibacillus sp. P96]
MLNTKDVRVKMERLAPASPDFYYRGHSPQEFWQRIGASDEYKVMMDEIRQEGERLTDIPIPELTYGLFTLFEKQGSRLEYESVYFERRRRLNTLTLLWLLEPDNERFAAELYEIIWSICNEYTWCLPAHVQNMNVRGAIDLFAAETGFTLSEIGLLLGERLPPLLRVRIREEVEARLLKPYLEGGAFSWETATHNWAAVCAGSIGAASLLLLEPSERLTAIIVKVLGSMSCYLDGFGDDGACLEGLGYWNYGFGYFVYFADLLKQRTQGAINLFEYPKIRQISLFQQKCYLHSDSTVNFSDSLGRVPVQIGLTHYLARLYPEMELPPASIRASYTDDHCSRWAPALRNIVWYDPGKRHSRWRDADYYLPDAEWIVSRYSTKHGSFGFAAKGGSNDEPHNHNDIGGFILYAAGIALVAELGPGEYTAAYFGEGRYSFDCNGSQGHSVPIVDGCFQQSGRASRAKVLEAVTGDEEARFRLDMTAAYPVPHLSSLMRQLVWNKSGLPSLQLTDEFNFTSVPGSLVERIVTMCPPVMQDAGAGGTQGQPGSLLLRGNSGRHAARARYDPEQVRPMVTKRVYSNHFGSSTPWYTVDFELLHPERSVRVELNFATLWMEWEGDPIGETDTGMAE